MSLNHEVGKVSIPSGSISTPISFQKNYSTIPSIKITTNKNINIFINNVTSNGFSIEKSELEEATIYYIVIGS